MDRPNVTSTSTTIIHNLNNGSNSNSNSTAVVAGSIGPTSGSGAATAMTTAGGAQVSSSGPDTIAMVKSTANTAETS